MIYMSEDYPAEGEKRLIYKVELGRSIRRLFGEPTVGDMVSGP